MCGIAGFISNNKLDSTFVLNAMLTRIKHRGPDECGLYVSEEACMGNVRLSIVDLKSGQQPLSTPDGRFWIAYNGEVFNYLELKKDLERKGHVFRTNCDTEVVVHMYQEYGPNCLSHFNGQFAFSIWDEQQKELFIARDRMGIRPLFYTLHNQGLVYGSEIKSIFEFPGIKREINYSGVQQLFTFWTTLSPKTFFKDVFELPAGCYAKFKNGQLSINSYWDLNYSEGNSLSLEEAKEQFTYLFKDSLSLRMRADVPVAAYLSGGLDSTSTTAFIKKMFPEALNTFSIGFEEEEFDESGYQFEVANYLDTRHKSVSFQNSDIIDLFEKVIWHTEIPVLRSAPFPMFKLSKLVRDNGIKVVITGEGADEMLGGYNIFKEAIIRKFWSKYPNSKLRPLLLKKLYPYLPLFNAKNNSSALKLFFGYKLTETDSPIYSHILRWNNTSRILNHLSKPVKETLNGSNVVNEFQNQISDKLIGLSLLKRAQFLESSVFMSGYLLSSQGDRMAMGNSVEGRYPFLDHRIIEFCSGLPDSLKLNGLNEKFLLKKVVENDIPKSVLNRPKQAYRAPISQALLNDKRSFVNDVLSASEIKNFGLFDDQSVLQLINKMQKAPSISEIDNMALMGMLSSQILYRQFIQDYKPLKKGEIHEGVIRN